VGHPVAKLVRQSFGTVSLRGLERGHFRALSRDEVARLKEIGSGTPAALAGHGKTGASKQGFAKVDPDWLKRRVKGNRKRTAKRG
jgi:hypothetical protein